MRAEHPTPLRHAPPSLPPKQRKENLLPKHTFVLRTFLREDFSSNRKNLRAL